MVPLLLLHLLAPDSTGYWQQQVRYAITARLDEPSGVLTGRARIVYINQSPDTLRDFYVHQYLNAFRPGSRWAAADSVEGKERFGHLTDPDYAFERITSSRVGSVATRPDYPYAPDSTIAHWRLERPLAPGDSLTVEVEWQARPSTVPRRQGRAGRRFDFAQWYPKVVVYDKYGWEDHPLYPSGEFYGEFATFDVTLDLAADQVIGATGVPVEGDPGWDHARADRSVPVDYQRDFYRGPIPSTCGQTGPGRKCVHFRAEQVHHFAFSLNPEYVYEQGRYGNAVVRVLYQPGDTASWGKGIAVERTAGALAWLDGLFGPYQWPQLTNVHRIEGGGTEFPMMIMNGSASLGLIVHESGHQYVMGQLANNEWREGWLDEGFTSFQAALFNEVRGRSAYPGLESEMLWFDLQGWSEPISQVSERFNDFLTYQEMIYAKAQLFYEQLRYVVGDVAMADILRTYFARWKLKHVDEDAFRRVAEEVSHRDLKWLFAQWLHGVPMIDYRMRSVTRHALPGGRWRTTVEVERKGNGWMPVEVGDRDTIYGRLEGQAPLERLEFVTASKPERLMLDPRLRTHDWNMLNNYESRGLEGSGKWEVKVDNPTNETVRRDRMVRAFVPVGWYNDFGGVTVGVRQRGNYFGTFERDFVVGSVATRGDATAPVGGYFRIRNPLPGDVPTPHLSNTFAVWFVEGRAGGSLDVDVALKRHPGFGPDPHAGFDAIWMATTGLGYLDPALWEPGGTVEAGPRMETTVTRGGQVLKARLAGRVGVAYWNPGPGQESRNRYDFGAFGRLWGEASVRRPFVLGTRLGVRVFGGGYLSHTDPLAQRRIMLAGAGPYETFTNPLLRSKGALFVRPDFQYHEPGEANLRAFRPDLGGRWALAVNGEVSRVVWQRKQGFVRDFALGAFADVGVVDSMATFGNSSGQPYSGVHDLGLGLTSRQQLGELEWVLRVEFPLEMNLPDLAADGGSTDHVAFRWLVSLRASF